MGLKLVPAPGRQFRTYSMWLGIAIGSFDALVLLLKAFGDTHILSAEAVLAINAVLGFLIVPAKLILQNVPTTTEEKIELVAHAAAQPMTGNSPNLEVKIDDVPVPDKPK